MVGCKGLPTAIQKLRGAELRGHRLGVSRVQNEESLPLVFCMKCGAYSSKRCVLLAGVCPPETPKSGKQTLFRSRRGLHPHYSSGVAVGSTRSLATSVLLETAASSTAMASSPRTRLIPTSGMLALSERVKAREQASAAGR